MADKFKVLSYKYELIKANRTYLPYGYNTLLKVGTALEQNYADILLHELMDDIDKNAAYPKSSLGYTGKKEGPQSQYTAMTKIQDFLWESTSL